MLLLLLWFIVDPLWLGQGPFRVNRDPGPLKYLVILLGILVCVAATRESDAPGVRSTRGWQSVSWRVLPLASFAFYVFTGSLYARLALGISESFLQFGLAPVAFVVGFVVFASVRQPERYLRFYILLLWASLAYVIPVVVMRRLQHGQAFHTEIFLLAPLIMHALLFGRTFAIRWTGAAVIVVLIFLLHKNLGYLCMLICIAYWIVVDRARRPSLHYRPVAKTTLQLLAAAIVLGIVLAASLYLYDHRATLLPSGNTKVRTEIYGKVWDRFLGSPFIGDAFTGSVFTQLRSMRIFGTPNVTTHSDWLDTLAHGGVFGLMLFLAGIFLPLILAIRDIRRAPAGPLTDQLHILLATIFCGLLVSGFVSLFNGLPLAFAFWLCLGSVSAGAHRLAHLSKSHV